MSDGLRFNTGTGPIVPIFGGRLTLQSGVPVMSTSQTSQGTLYYAPYTSAYVFMNNGTTVQPYVFTSGATDAVGLSLTLGSNWAANSVHDVFVTLISGVPTLCTIPWTNTTTRATALGMYSGFLTNSASATARTSNSSTFTLAANQGSYLGTISIIATAGKVSFTFGSYATGGGAATFGVWNNYNRREVATAVLDSTASWTYASTTIRPTDNSTSNRVTFVVGLLEDMLSASLDEYGSCTGSNGFYGGVGLNSTTTVVGSIIDAYLTANYQLIRGTALFKGLPILGLNYVQALEALDNASPTVTFYGGASTGCGGEALTFSFMM